MCMSDPGGRWTCGNQGCSVQCNWCACACHVVLPGLPVLPDFCCICDVVLLTLLAPSVLHTCRYNISSLEITASGVVLRGAASNLTTLYLPFSLTELRGQVCDRWAEMCDGWAHLCHCWTQECDRTCVVDHSPCLAWHDAWQKFGPTGLHL
jgi:hypothetical protein